MKNCLVIRVNVQRDYRTLETSLRDEHHTHWCMRETTRLHTMFFLSKTRFSRKEELAISAFEGFWRVYREHFHFPSSVFQNNSRTPIYFLGDSLFTFNSIFWLALAPSKAAFFQSFIRTTNIEDVKCLCHYLFTRWNPIDLYTKVFWWKILRRKFSIEE